MANPAQQEPDFTLKPNPSTIGSQITGSFDKLPPKGTYTITAYSPEGNIVYSQTAKGKNFTLNHSFNSGIYYINIKGKDYSGFRKIVVIN